MNLLEYIFLFFFLLLFACKSDVAKQVKSGDMVPVVEIDSSIILNIFTQKDSNVLNFDNSILTYKIKQLDQFIDRFNFKENHKGQKINNELSLNQKVGNFSHLFDNRFLANCDSSLVIHFIEDVCLKNKTIALDDSFIFCKINYEVVYKNEASNIDVILKYQTNPDTTYQWVIAGLNTTFLDMEVLGTGSNILYPNAHDLNFMRLNKSLKNNEGVIDLMPNGFRTDFNSILLFLLHSGDLKFKEIQNYEIQFFQIKDWLFTVKFIDRFEKNSGWLIHEVFQIADSLKNEYLVEEVHVTQREFLFDYPLQKQKNNKQKVIDFEKVNQKELKDKVRVFTTYIEDLTSSSQKNTQGEIDSVLNLFVSPNARVIDDLRSEENAELISIRSYLDHIVQQNLDSQVINVNYHFNSELPIRFEKRASNFYALIKVSKYVAIKGKNQKEFEEIIVLDLENNKIANTSTNLGVKKYLQ